MSSKELIKNISFSEVGESGKQMPMDELREYQVNVGIHLSHHRLKILKYLTKHRTHPTVDIIYKNLSKEIHTLSKTTIYKHDTLKVFTSKGYCTGADDRGERSAIRCRYNATCTLSHFTLSV